MANKLTATQVKRLAKPGLHGDGLGLYLQITKGAAGRGFCGPRCRASGATSALARSPGSVSRKHGSGLSP